MSVAASVPFERDDPGALTWRGWGLALVAAIALHGSIVAFALMPPSVPESLEDESEGYSAPLDVEMIAAAPDEIATRTGQAQPEVAPQQASAAETPAEPPPQAEKNDIDIEQRSLAQSEVTMAAPSKTDNPDKSTTEQETPPTPPQPQASAAAAAQEYMSAPVINARQGAEAKTVTLGLSPSAKRSKATWQKGLAVHIDKVKQYPEEVRSRHGTGEVVVRFKMNRAGDVLSRQVVTGSGYPRLDEEAAAMLDRASPLPPPPSDVPGETFEMTIPIRFNLR